MVDSVRLKCPSCRWEITTLSWYPGAKVICGNCGREFKTALTAMGPEIREEVIAE